MRNKFLLTLFAVLFSVSSMYAQVAKIVNVGTAGSLSTLLGNDKTLVTDLTLTGILNTQDFQTIKEMKALNNLNMEKANLVDDTLPAETFLSDKRMNKIILPKTVRSIGSKAFKYLKLSEPLVLPSSLESIGVEAFALFGGSKLDLSKCINLKKIEGNSFSKSTVSELDFSRCLNLDQFDFWAFSGYVGNVILPTNLKVLNDGMFFSFEGTVVIPTTITSIGLQAFKYSTTKEIVLPSSLESIGVEAFALFGGSKLDLSKCINLKKIEGNSFSKSTVSELDFSRCLNLDQFDFRAFSGYAGNAILPTNLKLLNDGMFFSFEGTVVIPTTVISIGLQTFKYSTIKEIVLPASVKFINMEAFASCIELTKIVSNNPTPPQLGANVFSGVDKQACQLVVPDASVSLYSSADQWKDFLNVNSRVPSKLHLYYTEDAGKTILGEYDGVRIGEYYWMNNYLNHGGDMPAPTKNEIDRIHFHYKMFNYFKPPTDPNREDLSYWDCGVTLEEFHKHYGSYYTGPGLYERAQKSMMGENAPQNLQRWTLPNPADMLQLVGMCGHGTKPEIVQYLSYSVLDKTAPKFAQIWSPDKPDQNGVAQGGYYWWFRQDLGEFLAHDKDQHQHHYSLADAYLRSNDNKYSFNWIPNGSRYHAATMLDTENYDTPQSFPVVAGDFNGLGQTGALTLANYTRFQVEDYPRMRYEVFVERQPVRYCRPLSDEELGYKLYINQKMVPLTVRDYNSGWGHPSVGGIAQEGGMSYLLREISGEELLLRQIFVDEAISANQVNIVKRDLSEPVPSGYVELPRGYIRGLYVQYVLDKALPKKDMAELLELAWKNRTLWLTYNNPYLLPNKTLKTDPTTRSIIPFKMDEEGKITVYPNPTSDVLNVKGDNVQKVEIYDLSGRLIKVETNTSSVNVQELNGGMYVVRVTTSTGVSNHKITKK